MTTQVDDAPVVSPLQAIKDIKLAMATNIPVLLKGSPGVGKSDIARQVANDRGGKLIEMSVTYLDAVDIHGLPTVDKNSMTARWVPMGLLPKVDRDGEEGTLFIDEITNADQSVKAALYSLILDRKVGEYEMPAGWRVIAAGNRVQDRAAATPMPSALSARFIQLTVEPTINDWVRWAIGSNMPAQLISFLQFRPELLNNFDPMRTVNSVPRTWGMAGRIFRAGGDATNDEALESVSRLIQGSVASGDATEFMAFCKMWKSLPNADQVLLDPENAMLPDESSARFAISGALAARVTERTFGAMLTYMDRMPGEYGVRAVRDATTRNNELCNTSEYINWVADNEDLYL